MPASSTSSMTGPSVLLAWAQLSSFMQQYEVDKFKHPHEVRTIARPLQRRSNFFMVPPQGEVDVLVYGTGRDCSTPHTSPLSYNASSGHLEDVSDSGMYPLMFPSHVFGDGASKRPCE